MKDSSPFSKSGDDQTHFKSPAFWDELRSPGLTPAFKEIRRLAHRLPMKCAVASYKLASHLIWVPVIGGTGTGKSTVFNALCGRRLSATGVERPKTCGPVLFGHRETDLGPHFPFQDLQLKRRNASTATADRNAGAPGELLFLEHDDPALKNVILVDTPDVDSLELNNRQMVEDLYLLADLVIFVASQEKYADDVPFQFLDRIRREGKPFFLLVNKTESRLTAQDILTSLDAGGASLQPARVWMLPFAPMDAESAVTTATLVGRSSPTSRRRSDSRSAAGSSPIVVKWLSTIGTVGRPTCSAANQDSSDGTSPNALAASMKRPSGSSPTTASACGKSASAWRAWPARRR
ncbi:MAG: GTPase domain-containing protein, partial [Syntrophobacteraceae bacterium]|nr:GTPase domain-containing protein [Syntrophobacteraceae bacterium]